MIKRRRFLNVATSSLGGFSMAYLLGSCSQQSQKNVANSSSSLAIKTKVLRMGYQSAGDLVRNRQVLEKRLDPLGIKVEWLQFAQGPQLMEGMAARRVDIGSVGETPPIFAQVAGSDIVYVVGTQRNAGTGRSSVIAVPPESPLTKFEEIKGQEVYFQKGSASHYFMLRALQSIGLTIKDIKIKSMATIEARAAFLEGKIPVWMTGDPHYAIAEKMNRIRVLRDSVGLDSPGGYYIADRKFAQENPGVLKILIEELHALDKWAEVNRDEVKKLMITQQKLDEDVAERVMSRRTFAGRRGLSPALIAEQQRVADLFFKEGVIPKKINISDALLPSDLYAAITPPEIMV
ncbi:ABC transporter, substrate-binding protein, aliphatic sulfonates [Trichormus variabilis ATCC 29413]|uniref:ABC transporter, substrate-binding protein, aliphatic sulfonates n=2 Tax=Anabaena variabilis TaxID=264691 RepID=Q3M5J1_TRIV2|nr:MULTISPECIES: aliphatic sulfonate ABC transporter substrate-binding protein [Nostocaceae]ABA23745.1 ABC transporter, substrate-binding protein, aliphatic sulfonates [Trichormus variabilis ATCC 29413]MBC1213553.1 aliphatic sulfonate ABC transporter substrate-binding protein [Trichormus variabilis ARAD]MBC1253922.1 aliphatic sulfonate ABC transporter substrate-binding protein [Trichormus variabilis V5]MBC1265847.1 aliphatic sulfonate ABC transporter substrate-binding protein [Trichormus variab